MIYFNRNKYFFIVLYTNNAYDSVLILIIFLQSLFDRLGPVLFF
jgi:hypothetical protein